jgi:hypothetical protein
LVSGYRPCKTAPKQYNSGDSELNREIPFPTGPDRDELICPAQDSVMSIKAVEINNRGYGVKAVLEEPSK